MVVAGSVVLSMVFLRGGEVSRFHTGGPKCVLDEVASCQGQLVQNGFGHTCVLEDRKAKDNRDGMGNLGWGCWCKQEAGS